MKIIKNNFNLKILSLIVAIFLWSYVISEENPQVTVWIKDIPVVYENEKSLSDRQLVLANQSRPTVNIQIRGHRNDVVNYTNAHIRVSTDLSKYEEGVHTMNLKYDIPQGVEIVTTPEPIDIDIQAIIRKDFPVNVDLEGDLPESYVLENKKATPEYITVKGPRSAVESVDKVQAKMDASLLTKDIVTNVDVNALTKDGSIVDNVELGQKFVNINALVNKTKQVRLEVVTENQLPEGMRLDGITPDPDTFFIKGNESVVNDINVIKTEKVDISKLNKTTKVDVEPILPKDVSLYNNDIRFTARINVEKQIEKTLTIPTSNIKIEGVAQGKSASIEQKEFTIRVIGYAADIEKLDPSKITASIKAGEASERLKPTVNLGENYIIDNIDYVNLIIE